MNGSYGTNTLNYDESRCAGCGLCVIVCPHGVFALGGGVARLARGEACMECGACQRNCPTGAIEVESGVGCATALFYAALTGREACCGPRDETCCGQGGEHRPPDRREPGDDRTPPPCCGGDESTDRRDGGERGCSCDKEDA